MFDKILVPIDPSHIDETEATLNLAEHLKSENGQIILLSVIEEVPAYVAAQIPDGLLANAKSNAVSGLKNLVTKRNMDAETIVLNGHAAKTIREVQDKKECDLIIISSHKPTTMDYVLGSTASKVVRRAQCPVLVMR
ncbi:MAG: universal stress protein [Rhizobiaceae bacterium]|nr:universal stress protein [Rhizobiaceae bacterium]